MHPRVYGFLLHTVHVLLHMWNFVIHTIWRINGTTRQIKELMNGNADDMSAQVLRVIWTNPFVLVITPNTYFTVHEKFAPPDIIFNNRVHLISVNSKRVTFVEVDCDILNTRKHPFLFVSLTKHTTKLIILPAKVFYDLADKIDIADRKVVWLFHTTRCGSTAWGQVFNALPGWTVFSEPLVMNYSIMHGDHGYYSAESFSKSAEYKRFAVAVIKMYLGCTRKNGSVLWKGTNYDEYLVDTIAKHFPHHQMLVAYRDAFASCTSFYRTVSNNEYIKYITEVTLDHDPADDKWWFHIPNTQTWTNGYDHNFCKKVITKVRPRTSVEWYCFLRAAKTSTIRCAIEGGVKIKPIKYDSLLENRRDTVAKVFDYLDMPAENLDIACEALKFDSQAGVEMVSWESKKKGDALEWSKDEGVVRRCNMILEVFDLPDLNSSLTLPNSF